MHIIPTEEREDNIMLYRKTISVKKSENNLKGKTSAGFTLQQLESWKIHIFSANIQDRLKLIQSFGNDYELKHIIEISDNTIAGSCQYSIETIIEVFAIDKPVESIKIPISAMVFYDAYSFGKALCSLNIDDSVYDDFMIGIIPVEWFDTVDIND